MASEKAEKKKGKNEKPARVWRDVPRAGTEAGDEEVEEVELEDSRKEVEIVVELA